MDGDANRDGGYGVVYVCNIVCGAWNVCNISTTVVLVLMLASFLK